MCTSLSTPSLQSVYVSHQHPVQCEWRCLYDQLSRDRGHFRPRQNYDSVGVHYSIPSAGGQDGGREEGTQIPAATAEQLCPVSDALIPYSAKCSRGLIFAGSTKLISCFNIKGVASGKQSTHKDYATKCF